MSAYYGTPEGDEVVADLSSVNPQADVKPVDDPNLLYAMSSLLDRDFGYAKPHSGLEERRNWTRGILDPEAAQRLREWGQ